MHEEICPDKLEVRSMVTSMRRNYDEVNRERERSRDKKKEEADKKEDDEDEEEHTLSECEDCLEALKIIEI